MSADRRLLDRVRRAGRVHLEHRDGARVWFTPDGNEIDGEAVVRLRQSGFLAPAGDGLFGRDDQTLMVTI